MGNVVRLFEAGRDTEQPSQPERSTKRGAQLEDGYTRIANELLEAIAFHDFTKRQYKVLMAVLRKTFGYQKKMDWISGEQLAGATGLPDTRARAVVRELVAKNVLVKKGRHVGINTVLSDWSEKRYQNSTNDTKTVLKNSTKTVSSAVPKQPHTKETLQNIKDISSPNGEECRSDDAAPEISDSQPDKKPASTPHCPHQKILAIWAEVIPETIQHNPKEWKSGRQGFDDLGQRWKDGFNTEKRDGSGKLYDDVESGLKWWRSYFEYLRKSEFLMHECRPFCLEWVVKRANYHKTKEGRYHAKR